MSPPSGDGKVYTKAESEALIPLFQFDKVLNQDQNGRRISLLGNINHEPGLLILERAAFPSENSIITAFLQGLENITNLGANDVYHWYMSNHSPSNSSTTPPSPPDLKVNLIYPCTATHIRKYTSQPLRYVTETPELYQTHIKPYVSRTQRTAKRLDWIYNILDGKTEQEDVVYRSSDFISSTTDIPSSTDGFLLLPDLNWDRRTVTSLHLLALVQRRDIWSLRDLTSSHVPWLKRLRSEIITAAAKVGTALSTSSASVVDPDMLKCYVHYQPTYYHFHVHVVHVMLEAEGPTQSVGKAWGLENVISMLENMALPSTVDGITQAPGMAQLELSYFLGEESELWKKCFEKVKMDQSVDLNDL